MKQGKKIYIHRLTTLLLSLLMVLGSLILPAGAAPEKALGRGVAIDNILPDTILINGNIYTVDDGFGTAEAVAITGDQITAVGSNVEITKLIGKNTEVIDLEGKTVIPGIIDSHIHALSTGLGLSKVNLSGARSINDMVQAVKERVDQSQPGEWIEGIGWDQSKFAENRFPTRWDLDAVSPDNPVYLTRTCAHIVVANTKALELAGITAATPDPEGGVIVKDPVTGEPTGLLLERPAFNLVGQLVPPPDHNKLVQAIKEVGKALNAKGITGVIEGGLEAKEMRAYWDTLVNGNLTYRDNMMFRVEARTISLERGIQLIEDMGLITGFGNSMLKVGGVKITIDGGVGGRTSYLREPYANDHDNYGVLSVPEEKLKQLVLTANKYNWQVGVHGCGDAATDVILEAFQEANEQNPIKDRRYYMIHAYLPHPEQFEMMRELGIGIAAQPVFLYSLGDSFYQNLGEERAFWSSPHKAYFDAGIIAGAGSDSSVAPFDPFLGMWAAVKRQTEMEGTILGTEQQINAQQALIMYTRNAAYLSFEEDLKGSIEPGKLADMVIVDRDFLTGPEDDIRNTQVLMTILGGKIVYQQ